MNHPEWATFTVAYFLLFTLLPSVLPGGETLFNEFLSALHVGATFNDVHFEGFHIYVKAMMFRINLVSDIVGSI